MPHRTSGQRSPPPSRDYEPSSGLEPSGHMDMWRQSASWALMNIQFKLDRLTDMHQSMHLDLKEQKETCKASKPAGDHPLPWAKLAREFTIMVIAVLVAFLIFKDKIKPADVVRPVDLGDVTPWKK